MADKHWKRAREVWPSVVDERPAPTAHYVTHGCSHTREYSSWQSAKRRCYDSGIPSYPSYGGAGIRMCDRWRYSFEAFYADMGPRPVGTTLDRIDPCGNYEPENCRWADASTQTRNQRVRGKKITEQQAAEVRAIGRSQSLRAIGRRYGISHTTVRYILEGKAWA